MELFLHLLNIQVLASSLDIHSKTAIPDLTRSCSKPDHSARKVSAPVKLPSPPITHRFVIPFLTRLRAAFRRPSRVRKSWHRALPITVPPWVGTNQERGWTGVGTHHDWLSGYWLTLKRETTLVIINKSFWIKTLWGKAEVLLKCFVGMGLEFPYPPCPPINEDGRKQFYFSQILIFSKGCKLVLCVLIIVCSNYDHFQVGDTGGIASTNAATVITHSSPLYLIKQNKMGLGDRFWVFCVCV